MTSGSPPLHAVFHSPHAYWTRRTFTAADVIVPLTAIVLVELWLGAAMQPYLTQAVVSSLPPGAEPRVVEMLSSWAPARLLGVPMVNLLYLVVTTTLAYLVVASCSEPPRFGALLACAAWAQAALTLKAVVRFGELAWDGPGAVRGITDLAPGVGFGFLFGRSPALLYEVAELVNLFDAAYLYLFTYGVSRAAGVSATQGAVAAILPWALINAVRIALSVAVGAVPGSRPV
jgi:hypothetical protein